MQLGVKGKILKVLMNRGERWNLEVAGSVLEAGASVLVVIQKTGPSISKLKSSGYGVFYVSHNGEEFGFVKKDLL